MKRVSKTTLKIRKELSKLSIKELDEFCSMRISFKDTAQRSVIRSFYMRQRVAQELLNSRSNLTRSLNYAATQKAYQAKFGDRPPGALLKSVSAMLGTKDLSLAMQHAIDKNQAMDFDDYARKFFQSLVDQEKVWQQTPTDPYTA